MERFARNRSIGYVPIKLGLGFVMSRVKSSGVNRFRQRHEVADERLNQNVGINGRRVGIVLPDAERKSFASSVKQFFSNIYGWLFGKKKEIAELPSQATAGKRQSEPQQLSQARPRQLDQAKPQQLDQAKPQPSNQTKPQPSNQTKPQPSNQTKPQPSNQTKPQPSNQTKPQPSNQTKPQPSNQTKPQPSNQTKPQPSNQTKPQPSNQTKPQPSNQTKPQLSSNQQSSKKASAKNETPSLVTALKGKNYDEFARTLKLQKPTLDTFLGLLENADEFGGSRSLEMGLARFIELNTKENWGFFPDSEIKNNPAKLARFKSYLDSVISQTKTKGEGGAIKEITHALLNQKNKRVV
nr:hypothetical protein [Paraburkholderia hayleyella]